MRRGNEEVRVAEHAVVIAGAGPTGMMLAAELQLAGVDVIVVEPRANHQLESTRSRGLHARTLEVLDQRGVAQRFLAEGEAVQIQAFAGVSLDISDFPTRHNHGLALMQSDFERILGAWLEELGVPILRERAVTGFTQDQSGVDVQLSDGRTLRTMYLVGCDGGRSLVRKVAGIEFPGWDPAMWWVIAEVELREEPEIGMRGGGGVGRAQGGRFGVVLTVPRPEPSDEPTLEDVRQALIRVDGTDHGLHHAAWISRFSDMTRQAAAYRSGRVLLAGDAAHVHSPLGGQGLNLGVQDAVNLGWKLAQVAQGRSPERLLDTYHSERHPVAARVLRYTMAQGVLRREGDERMSALQATLAELLSMDEPRTHLAGMMSGLDVHYDLGDGHPLIGRRMPDLDLETRKGRVRVFSLLHQAQPLLLNFGPAGQVNASEWSGRVQVVDATYEGIWELPVVGKVSAPGVVLVRPDGHVAWAGTGAETGLRDALTTWCGFS